MKKITKAAIAGTVGAALLVGGAGSLAFWTDSAEGPQVEIQSGQLDLGTIASTEQSWLIQQVVSGTTPQPAAAFNAASDLVVPGDVLTTTVDVPVTLAGKNLEAVLAVDVDALSVGAEPTAADTALLAALQAGGVKVTKINGTAVGSGVASVNLTPASVTGGTVAVEIAVTFPWGTAGEFNGAKLGDVAFAADYTLTQVPLTPAP
ncbi:MAG: alternate-type signal peptide domain-containing protein [Microterricola sp.]